VTDPAWIGAALAAARPQAIGALLRHFHDLDTAEEAFQNASLRALKAWPRNGPPRDPTAWLIFVARNVAIDEARRRKRQVPLPDEETLSDLGDAEGALAERIDEGEYRDDILRLLFVCCHPDLPPTQQIALALRVVSGLTVGQIARAFLVGDAAMEQRITRAKTRVADAGIPFEAPGAPERAQRLGAVAAMVYLIFNEGYSATAGGDLTRPALCAEAQRLGRILAGLAPDEPEVFGLLALMEIQASRLAARLDPNGMPIPLTEQNRARWDRLLIHRGLVALERAEALGGAHGPYALQAALAACHARANRAEETDWRRISGLYDALRAVMPSPVVDLNRAVAHSMAFGPEAGLALLDEIDRDADLRNYAPLPAARGDFLFRAGRSAEAKVQFERAAALSRNDRERAFLLRRASACSGPDETM